MSTEHTPTAQEWMSDHPLEYSRLFDEGELEPWAVETISRLPDVNPELVPLSFLARHNESPKRLTTNESKLIFRGTQRVLDAAYEHKFGEEHAFFCDYDYGELNALIQMTSQLFFAWHRGCRQYGMPSPVEAFYNCHQDITLDTIDRPPVALVLMGAAALRSVGDVKGVPSKTSTILRVRVKQISMFGPKYCLDQKRQRH